MPTSNFEDEVRMYDVMSKLASRSAADAVVKFMALLQEEMKKDQSLNTFTDRVYLTDDEKQVLTSFGLPELNKAWRKIIRSVDVDISFTPELDRVARTEGMLIRPGDIVRGEQAYGFPTVAANWEVEIDLGIIRGKVSW